MEHIRKAILTWYQNLWELGLNKYPWRIGIKSPYEIYVAEILLQHTTVKSLMTNNSYESFLKKYPTVFKLNEASKEDLINIFLPLGLYNQKAERIKKFASYIVKRYNGIFPNNKKELMSIPSVGDYISNAILTFAYNQNEVPLDYNLKRIAWNIWETKEKKIVLRLFKRLAKPDPKSIYWALFDIGRFHCRKPIMICKNCPLQKYCKGFKK
ncbi:MAG: hypothetical protein ACTSVV_13335 [Promethearchaeota archaeon]